MAILELKTISKNFGGLHALHRVSIKIEDGVFNAVIGPNGAGKTTLFNTITKYFRPTSGQIFFKGEDVTDLSTRHLARKGIGRSFQIPSIFSNLTVLENIQFALISKNCRNSEFFHSASDLFSQESEEIAKTVEISAPLDLKAESIPHGDKRRLDIAIALAQEPEILLLDEPASGLSPKERGTIVQLLMRLVSERKLTVLLIEHDLDVAFRADKVFVLNRGEIIAQGVPDEIRNNREVQRIYLGEKVNA